MLSFQIRLRSDPGETQKKVNRSAIKKKNIFRYSRTLNVFLNNEFRKTPTAEDSYLPCHCVFSDCHSDIMSSLMNKKKSINFAYNHKY